MKKMLCLIPTLLLSVACSPVNLPAASLLPAQRSLATQTRTSAQASGQAQVALGAMSEDSQADAQMSEAEQMTAYAYLNEMANAQAAYNYASAGNTASAQAGYSGASSSSSEGDAWAGTCGPNADYNEQLVCSGVPASMLP